MFSLKGLIKKISACKTRLQSNGRMVLIPLFCQRRKNYHVMEFHKQCEQEAFKYIYYFVAYLPLFEAPIETDSRGLLALSSVNHIPYLF